MEPKSYFEILTDKINNFVNLSNPKLCILTPCYGGLCHSRYTKCLIDTILLCNQFKVKVDVHFCNNESLVQRARNNLVGFAMLDREVSHIMFIDSDISWNAIDVLKLLVADKEIIGGTYPKKCYRFNKIVDDSEALSRWISIRDKEMSTLSDDDLIRNNLLDYNINLLEGNTEIQNGLMEVKHLATGFMMIKRSALEYMMLKSPQKRYIDDTGFLNPKDCIYTYALFDCSIVDMHYLSEDWHFSHVARSEFNLKIYIDITINLTHTGTEDYKGSYLTNLICNQK